MDTLFGDYPLDQAFDEMREANGDLRPHYRALAETSPASLKKNSSAASSPRPRLSHPGHHLHRVRSRRGHRAHLPLRPAPAPHHAQEWDRIERGLTQRITALNLFLRDVYSDAKILSDRIIPRELVYSCKHYRRQMRGLQVPRNVYIAVVGSDLLRSTPANS